MTAYAIAHMRQVTRNAEVVEYLQKIDATLAPYDGHFIVHGGEVEVLEGSWPGFVIAIEFPDLAAARAWYASDAYQAILGLRLRNSDSDAVIVNGVSKDHLATDVLAS
jgi:uncharacterized protein (DUF1330 family)